MAVAKTATTARCHRDAGLSRDQQAAGLLACSLCGLLLAAGFAVLLTGCAKPGPEKPYTVRLIRPDGVVHATRTVSSSERPWLRHTTDGRTWVPGSGLYAPIGWLIEVEPLAEAQ